MDIIIGIALAVIALIFFAAAWMWAGDFFTASREASPGVRVLVSLLLAAAAMFSAITVAHEAAERLVWSDEPSPEAACR